MIEVKESRQPITRRVINRLAPHLQKMCAELGVTYVDFKEEAITFHYMDLEVTLKVKSKLRKP